MTSLSGVWAASLTPLNSELAPDVSRLVDHVQRLFASGCDGIVLFGTTGEATSFSVSERIELLDDLIAAGIDPARVIVGVGCAAVTDTVALTRSAAGRGVAGALMLPPFYYKAVSDDDLASAYRWILEQLGNQAPPVLLYNIPQVSGVAVGADLAGRLAAEYPGVIVGIKDSSGNLQSLRSFLAAMPGLAVFAGTELLLAPGLAEGAVGTISAMANVNADQIRHAYESGGAEGMPVLEKARAALSSQSIIPALKAVVAHRSGDPGWGAVRPPLSPLSGEQGAQLEAALPGA
jgi:4-hydroxy-tetrahydrodipicolinate synthase